MKLLLTGHKGFIGSHMLTALLNARHTVNTFEWGDDLPTIKGLDCVIHIGAISSTTEQNVEKVMTQNYDFSVDLYEQCRDHNVMFQFSSSASVYGLKHTFSEDDPVNPLTPYAWSKYMFERYMQKYPIDIWQAFRYFNVYGPEGEEHKGDQASPYFKFKDQYEKLGYIKIFENSDSYMRDFIHVSEVVSLQMSFLEKSCSGIYNIGTGKTKSFKEVAQSISTNIIEIPMPDNLKNNYQKYTCADMSKTKKQLKNI